MTTGDNPFYDTYARFKDYRSPRLEAKHVAAFDREFWTPAACAPGMAVLEIGCGTGLFLAYLRHKGAGEIVGIDRDPALAAHVPAEVREAFRVADLWGFLEAGAGAARFDRVALFDVLEHFTPEEGLKLLGLVAGVLGVSGRVVAKMPNAASPWGAGYQYGDLTHRTAYTPDSLRQLALTAGYSVRACYPHLTGSPVRRLLDPLFHGVLSRVLMTPPEIWTANFLAVLEPGRR